MATMNDMVKPKHEKGYKWTRPDNYEDIRRISAKTSRILWYCSASCPFLAAMAIIYDFPALMAYNLAMMAGTGALLALRFALISRQMQTGDLAKSRIKDAFKDKWWFPN